MAFRYLRRGLNLLGLRKGLLDRRGAIAPNGGKQVPVVLPDALGGAPPAVNLIAKDLPGISFVGCFFVGFIGSVLYLHQQNPTLHHRLFPGEQLKAVFTRGRKRDIRCVKIHFHYRSWVLELYLSFRLKYWFSLFIDID